MTIESGTLAINNGLTVNPAGNLNVEGGGELSIELAGDTSGLVDAAGVANLDGTLDLEATGNLGDLGTEEWGYKTRKIIEADGGINGEFTTEPGAGEHLGHGVFYEDATYNATKVEVSLFQAGPGDVNGDAYFSFTDLIDMFAESGAYYGDTSVTDREWVTGDFNGDGAFTFSDLIDAFGECGKYSGDPVVAEVEDSGRVYLGDSLILDDDSAGLFADQPEIFLAVVRHDHIVTLVHLRAGPVDRFHVAPRVDQAAQVGVVVPTDPDFRSP